MDSSVSFSTQEIFLSLKGALEKYQEGVGRAAAEGCVELQGKAAELKRRVPALPALPP